MLDQVALSDAQLLAALEDVGVESLHLSSELLQFPLQGLDVLGRSLVHLLLFLQLLDTLGYRTVFLQLRIFDLFLYLFQLALFLISIHDYKNINKT